MFYSKYLFLLFLSCFILIKSTTVHGLIDPFTGAIAAGSLISGYFFNEISNYTKSLFNTNCPNKIDINELQRDMDINFFGQHIASKIILSALRGNLHRSSNNKKALVMSFHGWPGCGKNFISDIIANHMFSSEEIKKLRYHIYPGDHDLTTVYLYKEEIYKTIKSAIKSCKTNLFIFDEVQQMPNGVLDILIPIITNHGVSIDSRNSIFIFLTNAGSDAIVEKYLDLWTKGYSREQMNIKDFDSILQKSAFNEIGTLKKSQFINSHIIDFYVPFLPLEKIHVIQCIEAELKHLNRTLDSDTINEILEILSFVPEPQKLFSAGGCKRIKAWVTTESF